MENIPNCEVPECHNKAQFTRRNSDGVRKYRKSKWVVSKYGTEHGYICTHHHLDYLAKKNGLESVGQLIKKIAKGTATRNGFSNVVEYNNSIHPYRKYRKDFCENIDGRLGYICTYTPPPQELIEEVIESGFYSSVEVDHIDGVPSNNDPKNLQSLCGNCHDFKTRMNGDTISPGRGSLGLTANGTPRMVKTQNQI
jgi:hypothetical protein